MYRKFSGITGVLILFNSLAGCEDAQLLMKKVQAGQNSLGEFLPAPGEKAFGYLSGTYKDQAIRVSAILEAMNVAHREKGQANLRLQGLTLTAEEEGPADVSEDGLDVMTGGQAVKKSLVSADFVQIENSFFTPATEGSSLTADGADHSKDTVDWGSFNDEEFTISVLEKLPVRDQGRRGTCAAHAGIAQIEGLLIKKYELAGIDLSEQRFYYMSKPDIWETGGDPSNEGSNSGTGFAKSNGYSYKGKTYPPNSPEDFNIPLESDCPYNPEKGTTDTQYPLPAGCNDRGVAKVKDFNAWLYQHTKRVSSAQDIYTMLRNQQIPVVVATKLSSNWENNDGMITLADSGGAGDTGHAAGHAYVVVGAKKLDEAQFPNEGGMCFYIRNSWGRGWGVDGLSCMTLAWFNTWRYTTDFDQVVDVDLDPNKFSEAKRVLDAKPSGAADADGNNGKAEVPQAKVRRGTVSFLTHMESDDRKIGALIDDQNKFWKVLYQVNGTQMSIFGILSGETNLTQALELGYENGKLTSEFEGKGKVTVGEVDETKGILTLCALKYSQVCTLNYVEEFQQLLVALTREEFEKEEAQEPFKFKSLGLSGYSLDYSLPGRGTRVDIRMTNKGKTTNPLRFFVDPLSGDINFQSQTIGSITKGAFCTGDYKDVCRVITSGEKFAVLFKAKQ